MKVESIRTLTMRAKTEGFDQATAEANKLAGGMDNVAKSATGMAVVTDQSAKRQMSAAAAYKAQSMRLDETFRAQEKLNRETKIADSMLRQGGINEQQHAERIALITQRYTMASAATGKMADAMKPARYELINLSRQMQDVGVSLASGQSPFLVAIQQGTQMADIFASSNATMGSFFRSVVTGAGRFAVSAAGIATGIAAIAGGAVYMAASWVSGQKDIEKALSGIGSRSLTTAKDINELAETNAKVSSMSISESREAALEFVKTGNIQKDNIVALTGLVDGFSKTIGKSSKEAATELAKIFSGDAITAAQKLDEVYGSASGQQLQYIRNLENAGQRQQAIAETTRVFNSAIKAAADQTGFWAASWNAVTNAASNASEAIGGALAKQTGIGQSQQERLAGLQKEFEMLQKNAEIRQQVRVDRGMSAIPEGGAPGADRIRALLAEMAELEAKLGIGADNVAKQFGKMGDEAVRALIPTVEQLEKVNKLISDIQNAQTQGKGSALAAQFEQALNAANVLKDKLQQTADETARANANGLQLKETYGTTTVEAARTLDALKDQARVAGAVGGEAKMAAQEQARYNQLIRQGVEAHDAMKIATAERAVMQAQINAQAGEMLFSLQNQAAASAAVTGNEKIKAQAAATYNQLIHDGVNASIAAAVAAQQEANARAQVTAQVKEQVFLLNQSTELIKARVNGTEAVVRAEQAYTNAVRAGADQGAARELADATYRNVKAQENAAEAAKEAARALAEEKLVVNSVADAWKAYTDGIISWSRASDLANDSINSVSGNLNRNAAAAQAAAAAAERYEQAWLALGFLPFALLDEQAASRGTDIYAGLYKTKEGGYSQFNPEGYQSTTTWASQQLYMLTARYGSGGFDPKTGEPNAQGLQYALGNTANFNSILGGGLTSNRYVTGAGGITTQEAYLDPNRVSLAQRAADILPKDQQIAAYQQLLAAAKGAPTSLEQAELVHSLTDKIEQLTQAMQDNTSATQTMTDVLSPYYSTDPRQTHLGFRAFAGGGIMTQFGELPLRRYAMGGVATMPQVAMFGEGSTPEAYVPVPSGHIPVEIRGAANSNQRPVNVTINVMGNADSATIAALKQTGFQKAQAMRRVTG